LDNIINSQTLAAIVQALLIPILPTVAAYAIEWFKAKTKAVKEQTKNDDLHKYIDMLGENAADVVAALNQEMVENMKKMSADGKLTIDEINTLKETATNRVINILGENGIKLLKEVFGDIVLMIENKIEAEVNASKRG